MYFVKEDTDKNKLPYKLSYKTNIDDAVKDAVELEENAKNKSSDWIRSHGTRGKDGCNLKKFWIEKNDISEIDGEELKKLMDLVRDSQKFGI